MVKLELTSGFLTSPSGELFTHPLLLLAAVLQPQKVHIGIFSKGNIQVTRQAVVSSKPALGCGDFTYECALGSSAYAWLDEDRMASVSGPGVSVQYTYDADGRRVKEVSGGAVKQYLIDRLLPYGQVVVETNGSGNLNAEYVYGLERVSQERGGVRCARPNSHHIPSQIKSVHFSALIWEFPAIILSFGEPVPSYS